MSLTYFFIYALCLTLRNIFTNFLFFSRYMYFFRIILIDGIASMLQYLKPWNSTVSVEFCIFLRDDLWLRFKKKPHPRGRANFTATQPTIMLAPVVDLSLLSCVRRRPNALRTADWLTLSSACPSLHTSAENRCCGGRREPEAPPANTLILDGCPYSFASTRLGFVRPCLRLW